MKIGSRNKVRTEFNMSSMTDLVFLLLIFFIIVSTLVSPNAVKVDLPTGNTTVKNPKTVIAVTITKELQHFVDNKPVAVDQLDQAMAAAFEAKGPTAPNAKKNVILSVDEAVPSEELVNVLVISKRNKWGIAIATEGKKNK